MLRPVRMASVGTGNGNVRLPSRALIPVRGPRAWRHTSSPTSHCPRMLQGPSGFFLVEIIFVLNLVSWVWWRCYQLPFKVVKACIFDGFIPLYDKVCWPKPVLVLAGCYGFIYLLLALCLMHCWWLYLLLRIAYKLVLAPGKGHDAGREEYEGDSDDEDKED